MINDHEHSKIYVNSSTMHKSFVCIYLRVTVRLTLIINLYEIQESNALNDLSVYLLGVLNYFEDFAHLRKNYKSCKNKGN